MSGASPGVPPKLWRWFCIGGVGHAKGGMTTFNDVGASWHECHLKYGGGVPPG
jgi:hypothetical protein